MQCAAVLLLEVGYQSRHTNDNQASITNDIQKLISWLHAMQQNDPVADRAYHVVRRILENVAPFLQDKATELLADVVANSALDAQRHKHFTARHVNQSTGLDWSQGNFFDGSASVTGHQYYPQGINQNYSGTAQSTQDHALDGGYSFDDLQMSGTFGNPFVNNWDEGVPFSGVQNLWFNSIPDTTTDQEEDLSNMNLYPGSNMQQRYEEQQ